MCFDAKSSLITFLTTSICSFYIYNRNYRYGKALALFFFIVSLMQLSEFFMWSDLACGNMNHYATLFAFIVLCLEPLIGVWGMYHYDVTSINKNKLKYLVYIYLAIFGLVIIKSLSFSGKLCTKPNISNSHLNWDIMPIIKSMPKILLIIAFILYYGSLFLLLFFKNKKEGLVYFLLYFGSLGFAKLVTLGNPGTWKSMWCISVNLIPILAIFIGEYFHKIDNK